MDIASNFCEAIDKLLNRTYLDHIVGRFLNDALEMTRWKFVLRLGVI
jgi:hypothetical protein